MKIIWMSANKLGIELLESAILIRDIRIVAIVTLKEDSKTVMYDSVPFKEWNRFKIPIIRVDNINENIDKIKKLAPDLIVACGWRQIISDSLLNLPPKGVVGFHPTLLPYGRGPAPIINSILCGVKKSGLSMFYLSTKVDAGDIIGQEKFIIEANDFAGDVYDKVIASGHKLVRKYLPLLTEGKAPRIAQNEKRATLFPKRKFSDNEIKSEDAPELIYAKIRALARPYKGAYIVRDDKKIIIWDADIVKNDEK
ncbi:MAG: methionyl-tRNA formyltransferase [Parcubacteria group bacterium Licking1014_17]|nr:MAG: methionyl-tRNA formyltransferase [Parcubacteria group bacterium Licking1014_17]